MVLVVYAPAEANHPALQTIASLIFKGTALENGRRIFEAIEKPIQKPQAYTATSMPTANLLAAQKRNWYRALRAKS